MTRRPARRYVFLLRIWEERGERPPTTLYRYSLEDPHSHDRRGFGDLEHLIAFLNTLTEPEASPAGEQEPPG
jgi:hypothetical protein